MKKKTPSDFALGCIALVLVAVACVVFASAQTLLLIGVFGAASMLVLYLWSRKSRLAKAAALVLTAALLVGYVLPKVLEAARTAMPKDLKLEQRKR